MKNIFKDLWKFLFPLLVLVVLSSVAWLSGTEIYNSGKASIHPQQEENVGLKNQISQLQEDLDNKISENTVLSAQVISLQADKTELENIQTELLGQIQANETENLALQSQIDTLESEKQVLVESGQASQEEIDELNAQISILNETILANVTENTTLQNQITNLTFEVESLDAEIDILNTTIANNQMTINTLNAKVTKYISIFDNTVTEVTAEDLEGLTFIDDYMFKDCTALVSLSFPSSVSEIGEYAFCGCTNLVEIVIPNTINSIGAFAFSECESLESVTFEASTESYRTLTLFNKVFSFCASLKTVVFEGDYKFIEIGISMFSNCPDLMYVSLPAGLTTIGGSWFLNCTSLQSIEIPESITTISSHAFDGCSGLTDVSFASSSSLTTIGQQAFYKCSSLLSLILPASVQSIGPNAFAGCTNMTSLTLLSTTEIELDGKIVFDAALTHIYVPVGMKAIYLASEDEAWTNYTGSIVEIVTVTANVPTVNSVLSLGDGWTLNGTTLSKTYEVGSIWGELPVCADGMAVTFEGWSATANSISIRDAIASTDIVDGTVTTIYRIMMEGSSGDDEWEGPPFP